jgi:GT2 family glycosyltransferase
MKTSDVTIIIPHFGANQQQCNALKECIDSLKQTAPDIKRVVVKNGPACACDRTIRIIPQGQCKAVNAGVAITNTDWVFVSNDDMIYSKDWFENLIHPYFGTRAAQIDNEQKYCISPMLVEPRLGAPTFLVEFCGGAGGDFDKNKWDEFSSEWKEKTQRSLPFRTGFNLPFLIKRELWDLVGGYDIEYDPWSSNSDSDLEYKIMLAGIQPYQNMNSIVYHFSQTSGTFEPQNGAYYGRNFAYFKEKWGFDRTDDGIWQASFSIPKEIRTFTPWWENFYKKI